MFKTFFKILILFIVIINFNYNLNAQENNIELKTPEIYRGTLGWVEIKNVKDIKDLKGTFNNTEQLFFYYSENLKAYVGIFGADVMLTPKSYPLEIKHKKNTQTFQVNITDKQYGVRSIKVPQSQVELSEENLKRSQREREEVIKALNTKTPHKLWNNAFTRPVEGRINSSFGRQTKFNGVLNDKPHTGADFPVSTGTKIKAPAGGTVILTGDHFFAGKSVYVDHGQGLIGMFFHLSDIQVNSGDILQQGDIIGLSGATGRVSGAHLHYGLYLGGARLDPIAFEETSKLIN